MIQKHAAVTGTKGKTTVTRLLQEIAHENNLKTYGEYGIDGSFLNGKKIAEDRSAEEYFGHKSIDKCDLIISEATSYVLETGRYDGMTLDVAIFTGFEETEHSELYDSPSDYLEAKKKIFSYLSSSGVAIVNRDSQFFEEIIKDVEADIITYGSSKDSDFRISNIHTSLEGSKFTISSPDKESFLIETTMWGNFNISNMTAAFASALSLGIEGNLITQSFRKFPGIHGRSNTYHVIETNSLVVIDYAHRPASLKCQLDFLRENRGTRKIVSVFGCGGMKSESKRSEMGLIAGQLSDHIILTSDNPRQEHPKSIIADILVGIHNLGSVEVYPDREEAIKRSLSSFSDSIILIAGKGAEKVQEIAEYEIPMCDTETFEKWVIQNGYGVRGYNDYID